MSRVQNAFAVLAIAGTAACGADVTEARPQWVVTISTDAAVPQFGDRLLVEILHHPDAPACGECRRVLGVGTSDDWPVAFGVVPPADGAPLHVRARLHRADHVSSGGLPGGLVIDALGRLPAAGPGVTPVELRLAMDCLGVPADVAGLRTCDGATSALAAEPTLGAPVGDPPRPGSWPPGRAVPCTGEPPTGTTCVPGGAFAFGGVRSADIAGPLVGTPERLVQLAPFALDVDEMTVRAFKDLRLPIDPAHHDPDPGAYAHACAFVSHQAHDDMPLNCVSHELATAACAARGLRLPTEAEWELAAGNRDRESKYPWGEDEDACGRSVVGRGRSTIILDENITEARTCIVDDTMVLDWGLVAGGAPGDVNELGLKNLGGSLNEWVADGFAPLSDPCWAAGGHRLVDPVCEPPGPVVRRVVRGGDWAAVAAAAVVEQKNHSEDNGPTAYTGIRCAKSM